VRALLVDAFDSFAHIIYQYLEVAGVETEVVRSGELTPAEVRDGGHDFVLLGPGPGTPEDSGHVELVTALAGIKPVLGVCLGHQAIAVAFGGSVGRAARPMHGKTSSIEHDGRGVFAERVPGFAATRYHSLAVVEGSLPAEIEVSARAADDGAVMGLRHTSLPIEGVQFHPESVLTEEGLALFRSFIDRVPVAARS
jgi:anthranilate synthase component 2